MQSRLTSVTQSPLQNVMITNQPWPGASGTLTKSRPGTAAEVGRASNDDDFIWLTWLTPSYTPRSGMKANTTCSCRLIIKGHQPGQRCVDTLQCCCWVHSTRKVIDTCSSSRLLLQTSTA